MASKFGLRVFGLSALALALIPLAYPTCCVCSKEHPVSSVAYFKSKTLGVWTHVVVINLNDSSITVGVVLPRGGRGASEPFSSMISRTKPVAAITGTFFCTRSLIPIGDIIAEGRRVNAGAIGACLAVFPDNTVKVVPGLRGVNVDWTGCATGLRTGPRLLSGGRVQIDARTEGFHSKGLFGRRPRAAVGVTAHNKLLLVAVKTPVTFSELAKIMRALGAVEAINLDGGSSVGLSYGHKVVVTPGRRMTNLLTIRKRESTGAPPTAQANLAPHGFIPTATMPTISSAATMAPPGAEALTLDAGLENYAMLPHSVTLQMKVAKAPDSDAARTSTARF